MHTYIELSLKPNFELFLGESCISFKMHFSSITLKTLNLHNKSSNTLFFLFIWSKILSSSLDTLLKLSQTTSPQKLITYNCDNAVHTINTFLIPLFSYGIIIISYLNLIVFRTLF